jgi:cold shock CspA family protein
VVHGPSAFGVIVDDAEGDELFVHRGSLTASDATLAPGDRVEFEIHAGGMGAQAIDVQSARPSDLAPGRSGANEVVDL